MNKLWVFGDSFSEPFFKIPAMQWKMDYINWKGYIPKCYGEIVSDKLKLKHINLSIGGADNYTILDSIVSVLNAINTNDIVIIGWSNTARFRVVTPTNYFRTIIPGAPGPGDRIGKSNKIELSDSTLAEMAVNRDSPIYINELNNYIKLINFSFPNNKIIHWSPFCLDKDGLDTTIPTHNKYERVLGETNKIIDDYHYSENAHIELSEKFIDVINNYPSPLKLEKYLL
jgi:hypothetical protein